MSHEVVQSNFGKVIVMKIYIPSETYTGKPIVYLDDGEKEDLEKMEMVERDYYIWLGEVCTFDDTPSGPGQTMRHLYPINDTQCQYEVIRIK